MVQRLSLRLADGGGFLAGWARSVMRPDNTAKRLRDAEAPRPAAAPASAPAPTPAPAPRPRPPTPPNPDATPDNPAGIRFQDGGHIPGSGRGDKIPAKYEPGEFVVSNDMIDDNPGLREQLSELRAETLAARGKTVEQADAQAIRGGRRPSLRAADGFVDEEKRPNSFGDAAAARNPGAAQISPSNIFPQGHPSAGRSPYVSAAPVGTQPAASAGPAPQGAGMGSADGPGVAPGQRGPDSLWGALLSPTTGIFPGSRAVARGYVDDIRAAAAEPTASAKVGQSLRATGKAALAAPLGLAEDILEPWTRALQPVTDATANTAATAISGDSAPVIGAAPASAPPETPRSAGAGRGFVNPPNANPTTPPPGAPATPAAPSNITRVGNAYSGGPNISGDITVNGQAPGGGAISAQNMAAADALAARETLRGMGGGAGASFPGRPAMPSAQHSGNSWEAANNLRNLRVGASSITNRRRWGGEGSKSADVQAYLAAQNADTALRGGMDPGSIARTNATASMYGDETRADAARYASDNSLRGTMASAGANRASAEARLRYDMDKDARDFNLRSEEAGLKRQETQLKQREASEKSVYDQILNTLPPGPDGKPDTAAAAEYMRGLSARVADRQTKLEAHLAANPGDKQAQSELQNIMARGVGALGQRSKDMFLTGMEAKGLRKASSGMAPWAGRDIATNRPITSLRRDPGLIWDDYVDDQGGRIPAYAIDKEGAGLFGLGGRPSNKFDPLKER